MEVESLGYTFGAKIMDLETKISAKEAHEIASETA